MVVNGIEKRREAVTMNLEACSLRGVVCGGLMGGALNRWPDLMERSRQYVNEELGLSELPNAVASPSSASPSSACT